MKKSRFLCLLLSLVLAFAVGLTACGGGGSDDGDDSSSSSSVIGSSSASSSSASSAGGRPGGGKTQITLWGNGDDNEQAVYTKLANDFNASQNEIKLNYIYQEDLAGALANRLGTTEAPDIFYVGDGDYKKYVEAGYCADITGYIDNSEVINIDDMWPSIKGRYYYNLDTHRGGDDAGNNGKWYALPKDIGPTVIYYNATMFQTAGVTVISVAAEDLAAFNAGTLVGDYEGRKKAQIGIVDQVKEKGFFTDTKGTATTSDDKMFFNNQIPMNWDEVRELAAVISDKCSTSANKVDGYHTQWWFAYGWSVGGDCIQYIDATGTADASLYDGAGFYDFTLVDDTKNFIVADFYTDGIDINGNHYGPGEIISYQDKLTNEYDLAGKTSKAADANYDDTLEMYASVGIVNELPSQREAFIEFVKLSTKSGVNITVDGVNYGNGYEICPTPDSMGGTDGAKTSQFTSGKLGMLVDGRWNVTNFRDTDTISFDWDVAPLPIYKQYDSNGNVTVHGVQSGHSGSVGFAINSKASSKIKDAAWKVIEYLAGPVGQTVQSRTGFAIPSQMSIAMDETTGDFLNQYDSKGNLLRPYNAKVFIDAAMNQHEGDWSYLKTGSAWIDAWANSLNGEVRNGSMSFTAFLNHKTFKDTYDLLKDLTLASKN